MKKIITMLIIPVLLVAGIIVFSASAYTVKENYNAIITRMGRISYIEESTGLHLHVPFIESSVNIYTGDRLYDIPTSDVITSDKKSMIADDYVIWTVTNPTMYYQALGGIQGRAEERIEAAVYNATKNTISSMTQDEIIEARGSTLTDLITKASNKDVQSLYGIIIKRAEIKALDLPDDNKQAVYDRMTSERNNIAAGYTAQGEADAKKITNETDKQVQIVTAEAKAEAAKIIAEGEAEYMRILSNAYNEPGKADFYNFMRSLDALDAMKGTNKTLILDKDSEFARLLYGY